jgi:FemAB-related protein (PEP-CTERM system-associated)
MEASRALRIAFGSFSHALNLHGSMRSSTKTVPIKRPGQSLLDRPLVNTVLCEERDRSRWTTFIERERPGYHAFSWEWREIIEQTFGHRPCYLMAETSGGTGGPEVMGVLPLFFVKGPLVGRALISLPYLNGSGIYSTSQAATEHLLRAVASLAHLYRVTQVELRHRETSPPGLDVFSSSEPPTESKVSSARSGTPKFVERSHKSAVVLQLPETADRLFASFPGKLRSQIRRPTKDGATSETISGDSPALTSHVDRFYTVFAENMRELGTPVYPKRLFDLTLKAFGKNAALHLVHLHGEPVAGGITVSMDGRTEIPWASSLRKCAKSAPNMLLYWEALQHAIQHGSTSFDFGRSTPGSGPYQFKLQWGGSPVPLKWHNWARTGELPNISPENKSFSLAIDLWKRLPLRATTALGPFLTRWLP